tara:strand:- start:3330 stop:4181 length:852 start_codon:yes stop_codon:yes gene_type:complete
MTNLKINILILNWNNRDILLDCIQSIKNSFYSNYKITVIDNGSSDDSIAYVSKHYDELDFVKIKSNLGYSRGYNYAFKKLEDDDSDWFLILNNDTRIMENTLSEFVEAVKFKGDNFIYGCKIINVNNKKIWYAGGKFNFINGGVSHRGINLSDEITSYKSGFTDFVSGCCMFIKKDLLYDLNGFNEKYNFYYEDVDLCFRAKDKNVRCYYLEDTSIMHYVSYSLGGRTSLKKMMRKLISFIKFIFFNNSIFIFIYYLFINIIFLPLYIFNYIIKLFLGYYGKK